MVKPTPAPTKIVIIRKDGTREQATKTTSKTKNGVTLFNYYTKSNQIPVFSSSGKLLGYNITTYQPKQQTPEIQQNTKISQLKEQGRQEYKEQPTSTFVATREQIFKAPENKQSVLSQNQKYVEVSRPSPKGVYSVKTTTFFGGNKESENTSLYAGKNNSLFFTDYKQDFSSSNYSPFQATAQARKVSTLQGESYDYVPAGTKLYDHTKNYPTTKPLTKTEEIGWKYVDRQQNINKWKTKLGYKEQPKTNWIEFLNPSTYKSTEFGKPSKIDQSVKNIVINLGAMPFELRAETQKSFGYLKESYLGKTQSKKQSTSIIQKESKNLPSAYWESIKQNNPTTFEGAANLGLNIVFVRSIAKSPSNLGKITYDKYLAPTNLKLSVRGYQNTIGEATYSARGSGVVKGMTVEEATIISKGDFQTSIYRTREGLLGTKRYTTISKTSPEGTFVSVVETKQPSLIARGSAFLRKQPKPIASDIVVSNSYIPTSPQPEFILNSKKFNPQIFQKKGLTQSYYLRSQSGLTQLSSFEMSRIRFGFLTREAVQDINLNLISQAKTKAMATSRIITTGSRQLQFTNKGFSFYEKGVTEYVPPKFVLDKKVPKYKNYLTVEIKDNTLFKTKDTKTYSSQYSVVDTQVYGTINYFQKAGFVPMGKKASTNFFNIPESKLQSQKVGLNVKEPTSSFGSQTTDIGTLEATFKRNQKQTPSLIPDLKFGQDTFLTQQNKVSIIQFQQQQPSTRVFQESKLNQETFLKQDLSVVQKPQLKSFVSVKSKVAQKSMVQQSQIFQQKVSFAQDFFEPFKIPNPEIPTPPRPNPPFVFIGGGFIPSGSGSKTVFSGVAPYKQPKYKYNPTFTSASIGITSKKKSKFGVLSGLGIRPIIKM